MKTQAFGMVVLVSIAFVAPAHAHHSFAMFDSAKAMTIAGTVKEFEWTNPHSWIHMIVADTSGKAVNWSVELGSPTENARRGWKADSVKPGDNKGWLAWRAAHVGRAPGWADTRRSGRPSWRRR